MGHRVRRSIIVTSAALLLLAPPALAQSGAPAPPNAYGQADQLTAYYAARWVPFKGTPSPVQDYISGYIGPSATGYYAYYWTQVELPNGASLDGLDFLVYDNDANSHVGCTLVGAQGAFPSAGDPDPTFDFVAGASTGDAETPGYTVLSPTFVVPQIIHAWEDWDGDGAASATAFYLQCYAQQVDGNNTLRFWGALLHWHRTISPAPATATFVDVPVGAFGFQHIEALAASGITAGCDATHFCPDAPVTRAQMAVFLAKALGLHWDM
ncbi:MAG: S-layer homology domain-containing protein [Acidobacteria bacterium]|nr:S-layer homology domain-containing protein [Acidobacteriota bacterium]